MKRVLRLSSSKQGDVQRAASLLKSGGLVAFATETVYGLGADALNPRAVLGIFRAKKRPSFDPLIVHIGRTSQLKELVREVPPLAQKLIHRFWPGPLTLIFQKSERVPDVVTAGLSTVAVRQPSHPAAQKLLEEFGGPIAAPSANRFGYTSPTTAEDVMDDLLGRIDAVLDGGASTIGLESTIVWPLKSEIVLLRPGAISVSELSKTAPVRVAKSRPGEVLSPGGLPAHYSPRTPMALLTGSWRAKLKHLEKPTGKKRPRLGFLLFRGESAPLPYAGAAWTLSRKGSLEEAASNLFRAMRNLDKMELDAILAEPFPEKGIGLAITDRLEKAAAGRYADAEFYGNLF